MFTVHDDAPPLSSLEGLTRYLESDPTPPKKLTIAQYNSLRSNLRHQYDEERFDHLAGNVIIKTPQVDDAVEAIETMLTNNRRRPQDKRPGLILTGDGSAGKTTTSQFAMKKVHDTYATEFPNMTRDGRVPVVYVEVPTGSTGKLLMVAFARFFGMTIAARDTQDTLMVRVCEALSQARTELIIIDELQNLDTANRGSGESIQAIRQLHSQVLGIFVLSGVALRHSKLFTGSTGRQLSARMSFLDIQSFTLANRRAANEWRGVVRAFEKEMPLLAHEVGSLSPHSAAIHSHTGGSISTLGKIFASSASALIRAGDPTAESISLELLLSQRRDKSAMEANERSVRR
jgi:hypothetical protein